MQKSSSLYLCAEQLAESSKDVRKIDRWTGNEFRWNISAFSHRLNGLIGQNVFPNLLTVLLLRLEDPPRKRVDSPIHIKKKLDRTGFISPSSPSPSDSGLLGTHHHPHHLLHSHSHSHTASSSATNSPVGVSYLHSNSADCSNQSPSLGRRALHRHIFSTG